MFNIQDLSRIKGCRFPRSVIGYAVWAHHRFALSLRDVHFPAVHFRWKCHEREDLLAERGVSVSYEIIRDWVDRFGRHFADCIKRDRPVAGDKWHLDEVVVLINGVKQLLWRAKTI